MLLERGLFSDKDISVLTRSTQLKLSFLKILPLSIHVVPGMALPGEFDSANPALKIPSPP